MKKGIAALLCATMVLGLTACGSDTKETSGEKKAEETAASESVSSLASDEAVKKASDEGWEIAVVPKDSTNPWFVRMNTGVEEFADQTGVN